MKRLNGTLVFLMLLTGILISSAAAYISVLGLSHLYSGGGTLTFIIFGLLEWAKILISGILKLQWKELKPKALKLYGVVAVIILMVITGIGVYGFLTASYESNFRQFQLEENKILVLEAKKENFNSLLSQAREDQRSQIENINNLIQALQGNVIEYIDPETKQKIRTTSSSARRAFEKQLDVSNDKKQLIDSTIQTLIDSVVSLDNQILELKESSEGVVELGPLLYLQKVTGVDINYLVNYMTLIVMIVFDPLAIYLLLVSVSLYKNSVQDKQHVVKHNINSEEKNDSNFLDANVQNYKFATDDTLINEKVLNKQQESRDEEKETAKRTTFSINEEQKTQLDNENNDLPKREVDFNVEESDDFTSILREIKKKNLSRESDREDERENSKEKKFRTRRRRRYSSTT